MNLNILKVIICKLGKIKASYIKVFETFDSMKIIKSMIENIHQFIQEKDIL
jgi:hypothetical protein